MQWPFGKHAAEKSRISRAPPMLRVEELTRQGLSDIEIIRTMRQEGYSPSEVDEGLRSAVKSLAAPVEPTQPIQPIQQKPYKPPAQPVQTAQPTQRQKLPLPGMPNFDLPKLPEMPAEEMDIPGLYDEEKGPAPHKPASIKAEKDDTEDLIEAIVEEKMELIRDDVKEMKSDIRELRRKIEEVEKRVQKVIIDERSKADEIKGVVSSYGSSISEMAAKLESMEIALKDSLRPMLQATRSLSEAIKEMKGNG